MTPAPSWWARNRLWVLLLVPLLLVALAATAFRLQRLYLPWDWTRPHTTSTSTLRFEQDVRLSASTTRHRSVGITVVNVIPVRQFQGAVAASGATLHAVTLELTAEPDVILDLCDIALLGPDGTEYGRTAGQLDDPSKKFSSKSSVLDCVPPDAPGPTWDPFGNKLVPGEVERPRTWRVETRVAVPEGVRPDRVVVRWQTPDYAVLRVPS